MPRTVGAENRLWTLRYSQIAQWVGLTVSTVRSYAQRGQFRRGDIESVLTWVNRRRAKAGLPMIGMPQNPQQSDKIEPDTWVSVTELTPCPDTGYNPTTGDFGEF